MKNLNDTYTLQNGVKIPVVGFGTWQTPNDEVGYKAVLKALEVGYTHIDTAAVYGNEVSVGKAIKDSGMKREEIFLTSKIWNDAHGYEATLKAFDESLERLDTDYLDLYLIHWPNPLAFRDTWEETNAGTWKAMEELYAAGKIKAIGVSNFCERHIDALLKTAKVVPMVNQIRLCPGDAKEELVAYCEEKKILLEAYSPLGTGKVFEVEALKEMASKYDTTVAKVCLRWSLQRGFVPLPKSITPERIADNADIFGFDISADDLNIISNLTGCCGQSDNPDEKPF
ncbi:MAG: aldo/keto reductase [Vallitaleaceae bacterium]|jgi:diketogulonate reductase-like aldo/keto reductase|nr:aldo/keto reductase [Vallitaleaceae bacterium]